MLRVTVADVADVEDVVVWVVEEEDAVLLLLDV